jgi:phosphate transport system substrate-binding protein
MKGIHVLAAALCVLAATQVRATETIHVKGSDTIGGELMPAIARSYAAADPEATVSVEALGSATAFVGLFDGSADVGEASRPINDGERARARALGLELHELVIGFDGVAVIVNPGNPITSLTIAELSDIFTGKVTNWKQIGGYDVAIRAIGRPSYSGTNAFFKERALRRGDPKGSEEYGPGVEVMEENGAIVDAVSSSAGAISYVGLGWLRPSVKAVPVSARPGAAAVMPALETVRTGQYPLFRPLLMYVPTTAKRSALEFVRYVLSPAAQRIVATSGYIPLDEGTPLPAFLASVSLPSGAAAASHAAGASASSATRAEAAETATDASPSASFEERGLTRVHFRSGSVRLDDGAIATLDRIAAVLKHGGARALITGHADSTGSRDANRRVARARAAAVRDSLGSMGVDLALLTVDSAGADSPTATNDTSRGRAENRRVDIEIVPDRPTS